MRVNSGIPEPTRGWGGANGSSVGRVKLVSTFEGEQEITVEFPECTNWIGLTTDLEFNRKPKKGEYVQVKTNCKASFSLKVCMKLATNNPALRQ